MTSIYRFKLSNDIEELLNEFARTFFHLERRELSNEWNQFQEKHKERFDRENVRLTEQGYEGDINAKIYRSLRYYHIKRYRQPIQQNIRGNRKQHEHISPEIHRQMVEFFQQNCNAKTDKPQDKFTEFVALLNDEEYLNNSHIKKSFKNMFYRMKTTPVINE